MHDTLINTLSYVTDTPSLPLTVTLIGGPLIPGASALVDSANNIWYIPAISIVALDTLTYQVCNSMNQCDTGIIVINVTSLTGIEDVDAPQAAIYPNPFTSAFTIRTTNGFSDLQVYDMVGRCVKHIQGNMAETTAEINCADLATGTYVVKMRTPNGNVVTQVTRQ
jgi:hypothetical protein